MTDKLYDLVISKITMDNWLQIVIILMLLVFFVRLPYMMQDKMSDKRMKALQTDSIFRNSSGSELRNVFDGWTKYLTDMNNIGDSMTPDKIKKLVHLTIMFGSNRTVSIAAAFLQHVYLNTADDDEGGEGEGENDNQPDFSETVPIMVYFIASMISSLKEDFTGEHVEPMIIVRMNMKDYQAHKKLYSNARITVNNLIREAKSKY